MSQSLFATLLVAAASIAAVHALAPDHWLPFAAVARARGWSARRTAQVVLACGFGHVTISVLLGLLGLVLGVGLLEAVGRTMEAWAGVLLVAFGIVYAAWGVRRAVGRRHHGHAHARYDHVHDAGRVTAGSLFLIYLTDPCVAAIPLLFAAAPLGVARTAAVIGLYEATTLLTMVALVLPARAGAVLWRAGWLDRWGDAVAGGCVATVGVAVAVLGW